MKKARKGLKRQVPFLANFAFMATRRGWMVLLLSNAFFMMKTEFL